MSFKRGELVRSKLTSGQYKVICPFQDFDNDQYCVLESSNGSKLFLKESNLESCEKIPYSIEEWFKFMIADLEVKFADNCIQRIMWVSKTHVCLCLKSSNSVAHVPYTPLELTEAYFAATSLPCHKD